METEADVLIIFNLSLSNYILFVSIRFPRRRDSYTCIYLQILFIEILQIIVIIWSAIKGLSERRWLRSKTSPKIHEHFSWSPLLRWPILSHKPEDSDDTRF